MPKLVPLDEVLPDDIVLGSEGDRISIVRPQPRRGSMTPLLLAQLLLPAIQAAVPIVESIWSSVTKSGPQKKSAVMEILRVLTGKLVGVGTLPTEPSDEMLGGAVEAAVSVANTRAAAAFSGIPPALLPSVVASPAVLVDDDGRVVVLRGRFTLIGGRTG